MYLVVWHCPSPSPMVRSSVAATISMQCCKPSYNVSNESCLTIPMEQKNPLVENVSPFNTCCVKNFICMESKILLNDGEDLYTG
uniref:Uncharacterized protein n=1 Tax=Romanomermis culicivorax TaxID=13658 RepID=A0A915KF32_ROMCU